jgi:ribonuclease HI
VSLTEILEAIQALTPGQRRQLYRRLRAIGLLENDELWSDTKRLRVAPAVRRPASRPAASPPVAQPRPAPEAPTPAHVQESPVETPEADDEEYHSAVRSKVVMGAPTGQDVQPLEVMAPVPGQAPEAPIRIIFDGGSRGNPGKGYGSYALDWPGLPQQVVQLRFGDGVTNNEAEYDTLISALEATIKKLVDSGAGPKAARLEIYGDSLLVVNQVLGQWEAKSARMRTRRDRVQQLLAQFGDWQLEHHDRENSVRTLGH